MDVIAFVSDKGGVGKSTWCALFYEFITAQGMVPDTVDADVNKSFSNYLEAAGQRNPDQKPSGEFQLIDTQGAAGTDRPFAAKADVIISPFRPAFADISVLSAWVGFVRDEILAKTFFLPNMIGTAKDQRESLEQVEELIEGTGARLLPPVSHRPAIYPRILEGLPFNFFADNSAATKQAREEAGAICKMILAELGWQVEDT